LKVPHVKPDEIIDIKGARQNNLKGFDLQLPLGELIVVTGVSGSGKSSLAFDTVYAEGQRRYVETFSPYARQFLDRMDKPRVDRIDGIPPAIAIDQTNPVRTSRSTVGTMTELNDHLKLLFARAARLFCRGCGREVRRDTPESIAEELLSRAGGERPRVLVTFSVPVPENFSADEVKEHLARQGYTRIHREEEGRIEVIQARLRLERLRRGRLVEDLETALRYGQGRADVHLMDEEGQALPPWRFSADLHCPDCDLHYRDPVPGLFSFNSPVGACAECRGFGRIIGVDYGLIVPDPEKTLAEGAVKPWQTESYRECQDDLISFAKKRGVPTDVPWRRLGEEQRRWVLEGEGSWDEGVWYGVDRFFAWLEGKAYKMHIRVLLSRYRSYDLCPACHGARLVPEALYWRVVGTGTDKKGTGTFSAKRSRSPGSQSPPGLNIHDVMLLPIERTAAFFAGLQLPAPLDKATELLLDGIRSRLRFLLEVGLGYLTLDRQSRTLSGGEVQRINLTTALGTSLVNTLFVLDEPSIGLHPRDIGRVVEVLHRLRDAGNSLLVVEHDPQIMLAADRILDIGPGPGERGGEVVFFGTPAELRTAPGSLTGEYLSGKRNVGAGLNPAPGKRRGKAGFLEILGASAHNLKGVDAAIPLNRLVCITGVSGSGKSTLVQDVLYHALRKLKGEPLESPGAHREIRGDGLIREAVLVDQSPIGRTARSNPASYVGAFDAIRKLFAEEPLARSRGYTAGTFSFNSGTGRCPTCSGSGFEHVEMQFLSDVYLRCPDCDGSRFRPEVLEVKIAPEGKAGKSIAGVLELTVAEALAFFASRPEVLRVLEPLAAVGLDYLRLGQPVPTLSGGEAQRLKLAGHLSETKKKSPESRVPGPKSKDRRPGTRDSGPGTLFLFDEPTTGLHFSDIATLLDAFRRLLDEGHSLVVIEHNLDVIGAADWIVDLGPEGGDAGGEIVCAGPPAEVMACGTSHTGRALKEYALQFSPQEIPPPLIQGEKGWKGCPPHPSPLPQGRGSKSIAVHNAREHNLKGVEIDIPRDRFTVVTGVSGSGKSTVAFDIIFNEGQRRYLESLNAYARQFVQPASRPDVDAVFGIPPTVAIEQRTSRGGRKSTVATMTELYHFLRLLFVKLGIPHCPECDLPIEEQTPEAIAANLLREYRGRTANLLAPLVTARKGVYTDLAKWAAGKGFPLLRVDGQWLPTSPWPRLDRYREHHIELPVGELKIGPENEGELRELLGRALDYGKGVVKVLAEGETVPRTFSTRRACPGCGRSFPEPDPRLFSFNSRHGWCETCYGTGLLIPDFDAEQTGEEIWWNEWWEGEDTVCPDCRGRRLRPEALSVRFAGLSIADWTAFSVEAAAQRLSELQLSGRDAAIARDLLPELRSRLAFLREVGLGYLSLDRSAPTLSGGEAQRLRLAAQLGSNLRGVCYILDEPTIGLHPRDNRMLLDTLRKLEGKGNTVIVVEHDEETIRRAEYVVDLGPGGGVDGGRVVAEGTVEELMRSPESVTGRFLAAPLPHPLMERRPTDANSPALRIVGADLHNLRGVDVGFPLARLICVTGVSGSGKSTLVRTVLHDNLRTLLGKGRAQHAAPLRGCREIEGWEGIQRVLEVDQTPIGKTPRSCPATYVGFWDAVRKLFAGTAEARMRGWGPARFSFNVKEGRCPECEGQGLKKIAMSFLPDVRVTCEACRGARFTPETLLVTFKGKNIFDILAMSVEEALPFFAAHPKIHHALQLLQEVGLGYLTLGQPSPTLSGGEAQRIKLVTELAKKPSRNIPPPLVGGGKGEGDVSTGQPPPPRPPPSRGREYLRQTLYLLDEPTIGLHMADVEKLIRVLHRLTGEGNTVVVIEHNLDVIAEADWIIDLGPEGGDGGGRIVAEGSPEEVAKVKKGSHTSEVLAEFLRERAPGNRSN
jgi:excinuclease ABC subunit A